MTTVTQLADVATTVRQEVSASPCVGPSSDRSKASLDALSLAALEDGRGFGLEPVKPSPKDRMPPWASLLAVLLFQLLMNVGMTIIFPTALSYSEQLGAGASFSGAMLASLPFAAMTVTYPLQKVMDRVPLKHILFAGNAIQALANVLYACAGLTHSKYTLLVARVLMGLCSQTSPVHVYISRTVGLNHRSWAMMALAAVMGAGYVIGPFLAFLTGFFCKELGIDTLAVDQNTLPGWLMAFLWFALIVFHTLVFVEPSVDVGANHDTPTKPESADQPMVPKERLPLAAIIFLMFMQLVGGMTLALWEVFVAMYCARAWGWSDETAGLYMACVMGVLVTACLAVGLCISGKIPDRKVLLCCCLGATFATIFCFDLGFAQNVHIGLFTFGSSIMLSCCQLFRGSVNALCSKVVPNSVQNRMSTWVALASLTGRGVGPLVAAHIGVEAFASTNLCVMGISFLGTALLFEQLQPHAEAV